MSLPTKAHSSKTGKDGVPWSQFVRDFGAFTVVLKYDNITVERHFSAEQIKTEVARLESQSRPLDTSLPRITRRKNAKPVQMFPALPAPELPLKAPDSPTDK